MDKIIKKINNILAILFIILLFIAGAKRYNLYNGRAGDYDNYSSEREAAVDLSKKAVKLFSGFFSKTGIMKFYSDIDNFARSQGLRLVSVTHRGAAPESKNLILNISKTIFTINVIGRYADIKNFLFILESQPYINSFESLNMTSTAGVSSEAALEIQYCLYSFESVKPAAMLQAGRNLSHEFKQFNIISSIDFIDNSIAVDIFGKRPDNGKISSPEPAITSTASVSITPPQILQSVLPASYDSSQTMPAGTSVVNNMQPNHPAVSSSSDRLKYNGYYLNSRKGLTAFIDMDGRVYAVTSASPLINGYSITFLNESKIILTNTDEPYDTLEAALIIPGY